MEPARADEAKPFWAPREDPSRHGDAKIKGPGPSICNTDRWLGTSRRRRPRKETVVNQIKWFSAQSM